MCTRSWRSWESKWGSHVPTAWGWSTAVHAQLWVGCRVVVMVPSSFILALSQGKIRDGVPAAGKSHRQNPGWEIFPDADS